MTLHTAPALSNVFDSVYGMHTDFQKCQRPRSVKSLGPPHLVLFFSSVPPHQSENPCLSLSLTPPPFSFTCSKTRQTLQL